MNVTSKAALPWSPGRKLFSLSQKTSTMQGSAMQVDYLQESTFPHITSLHCTWLIKEFAYYRGLFSRVRPYFARH